MLGMLNIILILVFILVAFLLLRVEHMGRKVKIIALVLIGLMLYFSVVSLFTAESTDLTSPKGVINAVYVYFGWLGETMVNLWDVGVETTGNVIEATKFNKTEERR